MSKELNIDFDKKIDYNFIKLDLKPLDLLVFRGTGIIADFIGAAQEYKLGNGDISHVGLVVTSEILPYYIKKNKKYYLNKNKRYVFESIGSGVVLRDLEKVIRKYIKNDDSHVGWCVMKFEYNITHEKFKPIFEKYYGRKYDLSFLNLAGALYPILRGMRNIKNKITNFIYHTLLKNKENVSKWQFCSELVANVLKDLKIMNDNIIPSNVMPVDFLGYDQDNTEVIYNSPIFFKSL
jgi:hypothetical protein